MKYAVLPLLVVIILNSTVNIASSQRNSVDITDLIHTWTDKRSFANLQPLLDLWLLLFLFLSRKHLSKFALSIAAVFALRAFSKALTSLPPADKECTIKMSDTMFHVTGTCTDSYLSGHCFLFALASLSIVQSKCLAAVLIAIYSFLTAASRAHYSADCLWGVVAAVGLWGR